MRWIQKLWAFVGGYFWLPCGWCGYAFGGHERGWRARTAGTAEPLLCRRCAPLYQEPTD